MTGEIFSLGHSNLSFDHFAGLLADADITAIADVRSSPFSKRTPWFSQHELKAGLRTSGIGYAFLGAELGGRPKSPKLFRGGVADYVAMANTDSFKAGIERLMRGRSTHRIAMVCSEREPLHCHRCLLIGRQLAALGVGTHHIHSNGKSETQQQAEDRLLREENLNNGDFLKPISEQIDEAYLRRSREVAYSLTLESTAELHGSY